MRVVSANYPYTIILAEKHAHLMTINELHSKISTIGWLERMTKLLRSFGDIIRKMNTFTNAYNCETVFHSSLFSLKQISPALMR